MVIPDLNVLIYAHNSAMAEHKTAKAWWENTVNGAETVGFPWTVALGFVRLMSNPAVVQSPLDPDTLLARIDAIIKSPSVKLVTPGSSHVSVMRELIAETGAGHRMITDVHLAALAIELDATLATNDADFTRFARLKTVNPLAPEKSSL